MKAILLFPAILLLVTGAFAQSRQQEPQWWSNDPPAPIVDEQPNNPGSVEAPTVPKPANGPSTPTLDERKAPGQAKQPELPKPANGPATPTNDTAVSPPPAKASE
jgi:hypothetical protein